MKKIKNSYLVFFGVLLFGYFFLLLFLSPISFFFDENLFMRNMPLLIEYGLSVEFLTGLRSQAPGPAYQIVHVLPYLLSDGSPIVARLWNTLFLAPTILGISWILASQDIPIRKIAFFVLSFPFTFTISGIALTELPAIMFIALSFGVLIKWSDSPYSALFAGIFFAFAVATRSTYLVCFIPLVLFSFYKSEEFKNFLVRSILLIFPLFFTVFPVFFIWGGLVPPLHGSISGFVPWHGILAFGYFGLAFLFLRPGWIVYVFFRFEKRSWLVYLTFFAAAVKIVFFQDIWIPMETFIERVLPYWAVHTLGFLFSLAMMIIALFVLIYFLLLVFDSKSPLVFIIICALGLILATSINVAHLFSSRYVAQILPFAVSLGLLEKESPQKYQAVTLAFGAKLGLFLLAVKYWDHLN